MKKKIFGMLNSKEFNDLSTYYEMTTFMDILGVSRREFAHSNFLGWLFDSKSNHSLKDYAIRKLLELCYDNLSKDIQDLIAMGNYETTELNISREIRTDNSGYIDIFMNFNIVSDDGVIKKQYIIIENKIESQEHGEQTSKYQTWWENSDLKKESVLMLYFTPQPDENITSKRFIKISYSELINKVLNYCEMKETNQMAKGLITNYICCLCKPSISQTNDYSTHTILAVSDIAKDKVNALLSKYNDEIIYIIDALLNRTDSFVNNIYKTRIITFNGIFYSMLESIDDEKIKNNINSIMSNKIKRIEFDGKIYKAYGRNKNSIGYLVRFMIEKYSRDNNVTFSELKKLLNSKEWLSPWVEELISKEIPEDPGHFYMEDIDKVSLKDTEVYVAKYWIYDDALQMAELLKQDIKVL